VALIVLVFLRIWFIFHAGIASNLALLSISSLVFCSSGSPAAA